MFVQIFLVILFGMIQDVILHSSQLPPIEKVKNDNGASTINIEDKFLLGIISTIPLVYFPIKRSTNIQKERSLPGKIPHVFGKVLNQKKRREVPTTSFGNVNDETVQRKGSLGGYGGYGGSGGYVPATNQSNPAMETFNDSGSFSKSFQTDNGISSDISGYQKSLPSGERGQAMQGQFSYTAPDGSTVVTSWTADERGFQPHVKFTTN